MIRGGMTGGWMDPQLPHEEIIASMEDYQDCDRPPEIQHEWGRHRSEETTVHLLGALSRGAPIRHKSEADSPAIVELVRRLCREEVERAAADLRRELLGSSGPVSFATDPVAEWARAHAEELAKYRGQRVAIHPRYGVVAHGEDLSAVHEEVRAKGLLEDVVFDYVPKL